MQNRKVIVTHDSKKFIARCDFESRQLPRMAGFIWNPLEKVWVTPHPEVAARLHEHCDQKAKSQISRYLIEVQPWPGGIISPEKLMPYAFQTRAARFALERNRSYIAADPGLGKTIIAALVINSLEPKHVVYVCPPFLRPNTENEMKKWCKYPERIAIVADTMFHKHTDKDPIDLLIVDEAHRYKSLTAKRTKTLFKDIFPRAKRTVFLSGTPMPNRPMELFSILKNAAPETIGFKNQFEYGLRYCAGYRNGFGWDFSGASNIKELATSVKSQFMLRIKKQDVLPELPEKLEQLVIIADDLPKQIGAMDKSLIKEHSPEDLMRFAIGDKHVSTYRRLLGETKCELASEFIKDLLEGGNESVLVFGIHVSVIASLSESLKKFDPIVITGDVASSKRQTLVDDFQKNPARRLFIGNIQASGVGFTLTKATRVVFVEASWVPAENEQASDRAHRIGQNQKVLVQYLVYKNSIDGTVIETLLRKRRTINHV